MKVRFGFMLVLVAVAALITVVVLSGNTAARAQSGNQQGISSACCPFIQPALRQVSDGCCKDKCAPGCAKDCCKNKCDPNCKDDGKKKCDPNCPKK